MKCSSGRFAAIRPRNDDQNGESAARKLGLDSVTGGLPITDSRRFIPTFSIAPSHVSISLAVQLMASDSPGFPQITRFTILFQVSSIFHHFLPTSPSRYKRDTFAKFFFVDRRCFDHPPVRFIFDESQDKKQRQRQQQRWW